MRSTHLTVMSRGVSALYYSLCLLYECLKNHVCFGSGVTAVNMRGREEESGRTGK